jgi:hypothetical protein
VGYGVFEFLLGFLVPIDPNNNSGGLLIPLLILGIDMTHSPIYWSNIGLYQCWTGYHLFSNTTRVLGGCTTLNLYEST